MNYKIVLIAVIVALATGGAFYGLSMSGTQTSSNPASNEYGVKEQQYIEEEKAKLAALEEGYKNDPYGGSTPEETLQLYIEALEKGDIEMAVNLFAAEDRERAGEALSDALSNNGIANYLSYLKLKNSTSCDELGNNPECAIYFYKELQERQTHVERFKVNAFTSKWKLVSQWK